MPRLLNLGLKPFLLPASINAVIGQRLVRRLCESCKEKHEPSTDQVKRIQQSLDTLPEQEERKAPSELVFYIGGGCEECQGLGYKGQIGVFEIFGMTKELEQVILEEQVSETKMQRLAQEQGMTTMFQDAVLKALQGITSVEEIFRVTKEGA